MARRESAAMRSRGQTRIHVATLRRQVQEARIDLATGVRRAGVGGDCQPLLRCQATRRRRATCRERRLCIITYCRTARAAPGEAVLCTRPPCHTASPNGATRLAGRLVAADGEI